MPKDTNRRIGTQVMLGSLMLLGALLPISASAQTTNNPSKNPLAEYTLLEPLPCIPSPESKDSNGNTIPEVKCPNGAGSTQNKVDFGTYVQYVFNLIIAVSAVAAVLVLVWGGFKYVTTDSFAGKSEGKKVIMQALQGLLLVLCSYLILRTIDPRLVSIPTTIVAPLDITYELGLTQKFFQTISSTANKQSSAQKIAETAAQKAAKNLEPMDQRLKELLAIIDKNPNSTEAQKAREELVTISNSAEYLQNYSTKEIMGARAVLRKDVISLFQEASKATTDKNVFAVNQAFNGALSSITYNEERLLKEVPDSQRLQGIRDGIKDEANYARAMAHVYYINYALARGTLSAADAEPIFESRISSASENISLIKNKDLRQEMVNELQNARSAIKAKYPAQ